MSPIPSVDSQIRHQIDDEIDQHGMQLMIEELAKLDPAYAAKVGVHDRKRLIRALEVCRTTGIPFSEWHAHEPGNGVGKAVHFGLTRPREELKEIIKRRVNSMIENGWIDETRKLATQYSAAKSLPPSVSESIGYRTLIRLLNDEINLNEAKELICIATRQFAKRQMTWFKADMSIEWLSGTGSHAESEWVGQIIRSIRIQKTTELTAEDIH